MGIISSGVVVKRTGVTAEVKFGFGGPAGWLQVGAGRGGWAAGGAPRPNRQEEIRLRDTTVFVCLYAYPELGGTVGQEYATHGAKLLDSSLCESYDMYIFVIHGLERISVRALAWSAEAACSPCKLRKLRRWCRSLSGHHTRCQPSLSPHVSA